MRDLNPALSHLEIMLTEEEGDCLVLEFLPFFPRFLPVHCLPGLVTYPGPATCLNFSLYTLISAKCWGTPAHLLSLGAKPAFRDTGLLG